MKKFLIGAFICLGIGVFTVFGDEVYDYKTEAPKDDGGTNTVHKNAHPAYCHSLLNPEVKGCVDDRNNRTCGLDVFCN